MLIKNENLQLFALEHARAVNNYLDCDVIQEAITEVENAFTSATLREAMQYLATAIHYRATNEHYSKSAELIEAYAKQIA